MRAGMILGVLVTVAVVLLIVQNGETARLDWLTFHFRAKLWLILLLSLVAGAVIWEAAKAAVRRGSRRARRREGGRRPGAAERP